MPRPCVPTTQPPEPGPDPAPAAGPVDSDPWAAVPPISSCRLWGPGHHPNPMAAWKQAPLTFTAGDPREVVIVDVDELTDRRGSVGIYTLTLATGRTITRFDHDPARMRALLAARSAALRDAVRHPARPTPHLVLADPHLYVIVGTGTYTLSLAPLALLDSRQGCRTDGQLRPVRRRQAASSPVSESRPSSWA